MTDQPTQPLLTKEKKEGYSLMLYLSHLCLVFPLEHLEVLEEGVRGLFQLKREESSYRALEWYELFQSTASYRLQRLVLGEESPPMRASVELIDKKVRNGELELELKLLPF